MTFSLTLYVRKLNPDCIVQTQVLEHPAVYIYTCNVFFVMSLMSHAGGFPVPAVAGGAVAALIVVAIIAVLIVVIVRARDTKSGSYNSVERPDKVSRKGKATCKC